MKEVFKAEAGSPLALALLDNFATQEQLKEAINATLTAKEDALRKAGGRCDCKKQLKFIEKLLTTREAETIQWVLRDVIGDCMQNVELDTDHKVLEEVVRRLSATNPKETEEIILTSNK